MGEGLAFELRVEGIDGCGVWSRHSGFIEGGVGGGYFSPPSPTPPPPPPPPLSSLPRYVCRGWGGGREGEGKCTRGYWHPTYNGKPYALCLVWHLGLPFPLLPPPSSRLLLSCLFPCFLFLLLLSASFLLSSLLLFFPPLPPSLLLLRLPPFFPSAPSPLFRVRNFTEMLRQPSAMTSFYGFRVRGHRRSFL